MKNTGFLSEDEIGLGQKTLGCAMGRSARRYVAVVLCLGLSFCLGSWPLLAQSQRPADWVTDDKLLDVDNDGDGLIEIWDLTDLNNIRHDLDGSHYSDGTETSDEGCGDDAVAVVKAGGTAGECHGYELMNNLDFRDTNAAGYQKKWVPLNNATVAGGSIVSDPADGKNRGWEPIGNNSLIDSQGSTSDPNNRRRFTGVLEGNRKVIKNLYINVNVAGTEFVGLFGNNAGTVRNLGLTGSHMHVSGSSSGGAILVGGIAGFSRGAEITNCHATGNVTAEVTEQNSLAAAGGLVGYIRGNTNTITGSYATGDVTSENTGNGDTVAGGLIGYILEGTNAITGSYATGDVTSENTGNGTSAAGGLVGESNVGKSTVENVYATGNVAAKAHGTGTSSFGIAGGLVGESFSGTNTLTNGYATGDVSATATAANRIFASGVLARNNSNSATVTACYYAGAVKKSLGFVGTTSAYRTLSQLKALVAGAVDENDLTKSGWDAKDWDFGDNTKLPRLRSYKETNGNQVQGEVLGDQEMLEREVNRLRTQAAWAGRCWS